MQRINQEIEKQNQQSVGGESPNADIRRAFAPIQQGPKGRRF